MKKFYAVTNLIVIVALIAWNYATNAAGINGETIGSLSDTYRTLFTPADYAFSIWGLIFLGLLAHGIYQVRTAFSRKRSDDFILQVGPWLILANLACGAWVWFWLNEQTGLSVIAMAMIMVALVVVILRLNMERWDAPFPVIAWVWWPFCLYSGWIAVATIANVAAYLKKIGWDFLFGDHTWALIMILVAVLLNLFMILSRNMREFAVVGVWALVAIAARHQGTLPLLQWTALAGALLLLVVIALHGYRNRATNPMRKWREGRGIT